MLLFPNCKINIGLRICSRRDDGYHNIETVMYPVTELYDALELTRSVQPSFVQTGLRVEGDPEQNICQKALRAVQRDHPHLPPVRMHLHKVIPMGAGLGGGSSDAAYVIRGLNALFDLGMDSTRMEALAATVGSDVPFFIRNTPALAAGRGERLSPIACNLSGWWLLIVKPPQTVSTADAYAGVTPHEPTEPLSQLLTQPLQGWRTSLTNAFEPSVFERLPLLATIKQQLYAMGASYASMSGSGSSVYGLFATPMDDLTLFKQYFVHQDLIR